MIPPVVLIQIINLAMYICTDDLFMIELNMDTKEIYADVPDAEFNVLATTVDPGRYYIQLAVTGIEDGDRTVLEWSKDGWMVADGFIDTENPPDDIPENNIITIGNGEVINLDEEDLLQLFTNLALTDDKSLLKYILVKHILVKHILVKRVLVKAKRTSYVYRKKE